MDTYTYKNSLVSKKQLKQLLGWSFTNYNCVEACKLADELKHLGFKYATIAGLSISIEDLKVPFIKNQMLKKANKQISSAEKLCLLGKITDVERFQTIIDTWGKTSEALKHEVISYFKNYEPLNSVYIMAFSGARGNISQVRQLVGMRGLMADPSGAIVKLPIQKNFREGLTITDYLISAYGARKGIIDTALKTANSGYLTRRLIDVAQDIIIREKDCFTNHSYLISEKNIAAITKKIVGRLLSKPIYIPNTQELIANKNTQITPELVEVFKQYNIEKLYIRSPLTCTLYRSICQRCYGWDIAKENLVDFGEAVGIIAGQSIGEPGTQLTMRTFHTGGVFTAELSQQIKSPITGLIKLSKNLKSTVLRTNKGETVFLTRNSGYLIVMPEKNPSDLFSIEVDKNTILFIYDNQLIEKGDVIGELPTGKQQIRNETVPILAPTGGEIVIPNSFKTKVDFISKDKLVWLLFGHLYNSPINSFINFNSDHIIPKHSFVFRSKLITPFFGFIKIKKEQKNLFQDFIEITHQTRLNINGYIKKWNLTLNKYVYILGFKNLKYLLDQQNCQKYFGNLFTNKFRTLTGGTLYYLNPIDNISKTKLYYYKIINSEIFKYFLQEIIFLLDTTLIIEELLKLPKCKLTLDQDWKQEIFNYWKILLNKVYCTVNFNDHFSKFIKISNGIVWLNEETYTLNCNKNMLLVKEGNFISKNFEIFPRVFSKTEGLVCLKQKNNIIQSLSIKSGSIHEDKDETNTSKTVYFSGETILNHINIKQLSFCENIEIKTKKQVLLRPLTLYEIPFIKPIETIINENYKLFNKFEITNNNKYFYKPNQQIKQHKSINLNSNFLNIKFCKISTANFDIKILPDLKQQLINVLIQKRLFLNHYIAPSLKSKNVQSCLLIQENQFLNSYVTFGFFESTINKSLSIVEVKSLSNYHKQILVISNDNCSTVKKNIIGKKKVNDLFINKFDLKNSGRILTNNGKTVIIQKGRPYLFPNSNDGKVNSNSNIKYKFFSPKNKKFENSFNRKRFINLKYYDFRKKHLQTKYFNHKNGNFFAIKYKFSKMFLQKNNNIYIKRVPFLLPLASVQTQINALSNFSKLKINFQLDKSKEKNKKILRTKRKSEKPKKLYLFFRSFKFSSNYLRNSAHSQLNFVLFQNIETKLQNFINIYPITEDFFSSESNTTFCDREKFVEKGEVLGLLNFEKQITGDIVQGLPRIEQLFEARKVKLPHKLIPINKKKYLLIQNSSIDSSFEFRKLGTTILENEKINPHKLLKVYFNYYGANRRFICDQTKTLKSGRLLRNHEACYRAFKKVQGLILNSIQSIYKSQGVTILNKHFEVIIKQMTTKVLITHEGNSGLLPTEIIDLYHIEYINKVLQTTNKKTACYVPILFGITKAALNNPSFTSAASFQETTRVLTKAAIEGRLDWLRGLKENIVIGRLIPAGTGTPSYRKCFKKDGEKLVETTLETPETI